MEHAGVSEPGRQCCGRHRLQLQLQVAVTAAASRVSTGPQKQMVGGPVSS